LKKYVWQSVDLFKNLVEFWLNIANKKKRLLLYSQKAILKIGSSWVYVELSDWLSEIFIGKGSLDYGSIDLRKEGSR